MLRALCFLLVFLGSCTMLATIFLYRKTIRAYANYLASKKRIAFNRHISIMIMMVFFLLGYIATLFYIIELTVIDLSILLIAVIFFFGAVFCYSVVFVQASLLNRLEQNADELKRAFEETKSANVSLELLNHELEETMTALKSAQSQLVFSEKMSTLGELMAGISHEINTPICTVRASAEKLNESFANCFAEIFSEVRRFTDEDFRLYMNLTEISLKNSGKYISTMETRALKRKAKQTLGDTEGFNDAILEMLAACSLLNDETVGFIAPYIAIGSFKQVLSLTGRTVSVIGAIGNITVSAEKIIKLISSLKSFSHFNPTGEKSSFNVINGIDSVLAIYVNQLKYDVEVVRDFEPVPNILGYEDELSHVWSNLIQNAIYAMHDGNPVPPEERHPAKLVIAVCNDSDNRVTVTISDNGGGISQEKAARIFDPFYTTKPVGIGTGLGLSISKQIIDKHDGTIAVSSMELQGTTFTIKLPADRESH